MLISYQAIHYKVNWKYKSLFTDDYQIINISDIEKEIFYCYDSTQYIMRFIEILKERVIRYLPDLNEVKLIISVFNKDNIIHRLLIDAYYLLSNILTKHFKNINFYKSIFTTIKYKDKVVFAGHINIQNIYTIEDLKWDNLLKYIIL